MYVDVEHKKFSELDKDLESNPTVSKVIEPAPDLFVFDNKNKGIKLQ